MSAALSIDYALGYIPLDKMFGDLPFYLLVNNFSTTNSTAPSLNLYGNTGLVFLYRSS